MEECTLKCDEKKEIKIMLYTGGIFNISFDDESEYKFFKKVKNCYRNLIIALLTTFFCFLISVALLFVKGIFLYFIVFFIIMIVIERLIYTILERKYNRLKYDLVINEIKKRNWKIRYSNNRTGHIKYSIKGEGISIDVFKGKGNRSAN